MTHQELLEIVKELKEDYKPFGQHDRDKGDNWTPDCSAGCKFFAPLEGELGFDWGVCCNSKSHRCGLLTFEHQGCPEFEQGEDNDI